MLRIGRVSVAIHSCLLGPPGASWGILIPTVISVSIWLPTSSVLSTCYSPNRHCVLKSLVTSGYDRITSTVSTTNSMYTCLLRATVHGVQSCQKRRQEGAQNGGLSPGNERCAVEFAATTPQCIQLASTWFQMRTKDAECTILVQINLRRRDSRSSDPSPTPMMPVSPLNTNMTGMSEERIPHAAANRSSPLPDPIRVKNRRKRYLDIHPEYFGSDLELAGVLLDWAFSTNI
jgi:hypothetical protein